MALHTLLALAATLSAAGIQDPRMDLQIAMPVGDQTPLSRPTVPDLTPVPVAAAPAQVAVPSQAAPPIREEVSTTVATIQGREILRPVSARFTKEAPAAVLDWLQKQDLSFVVNEDDIAPGTKITLKLDDVPLDEALDAIGSALGGHWERRGKVRVFHRGEMFRGAVQVSDGFGFGGTARSAPTVPSINDVAQTKAFASEMKMVAEKVANSLTPTQAVERADMAKALSRRDVEVAKIQRLKSKEMAESMAMKSAAIAKSMPMQLEQLKLDAKMQAEIAKKMRDQAVSMRAMPSMDLEVRADVAKAINDAMMQSRSAAKAAIAAGNSQRVEIAPDVDKLMKSLTMEQKDHLKKQGYLRYHELSAQQKALLGMKPSTTPGSWTIKIRKNQNEITIKE